jgi:hypothetical protein
MRTSSMLSSTGATHFVYRPSTVVSSVTPLGSGEARRTRGMLTRSMLSSTGSPPPPLSQRDTSLGTVAQ